MKRNTRFINAWIKALRSGKYKQTRARLEGSDGYCCLGVACKISTKATRLLANESDRYHDRYRYIFRGDLFDASWGMMPTGMREYVGLTQEEESLLARMNDRRATFDEIADWLEREMILNG